MDEAKDNLRGQTRLTDKRDGMTSSTSFPAKEESECLHAGTDEARDSSRGRSRSKGANNNNCHWPYKRADKTAPLEEDTTGK